MAFHYRHPFLKEAERANSHCPYILFCHLLPASYKTFLLIFSFLFPSFSENSIYGPLSSKPLMSRAWQLLLLFFFFLTFIYLFIWLPQVLVQQLKSGIFHLHCSTWGSTSLTQMLNPGPLHWEAGVLATGPPGKSHSGGT